MSTEKEYIIHENTKQKLKTSHIQETMCKIKFDFVFNIFYFIA